MTTSPAHFYISTNLLAGHSWKFILIQAVIAILLGIFFMVHYASALIALAILLGIMLLGSGLQGFALMALNRKFSLGFALYSLLLFVAGATLVAEPLTSAAWLLLVLGIWFVIHAVELLVAAFVTTGQPRQFRIMVGANGVLSLIFGILIMQSPIAAAGWFNFIFAFFLIFYGVITLGVGLRFRKLSQASDKKSDDEN